MSPKDVKSKETGDYVEALCLKAIEFIAVLEEFLDQNRENLTTGPDAMTEGQKQRTKDIQEKRDALFSWFQQQYDQAEKEFAEYLTVE